MAAMEVASSFMNYQILTHFPPQTPDSRTPDLFTEDIFTLMVLVSLIGHPGFFFFSGKKACGWVGWHSNFSRVCAHAKIKHSVDAILWVDMAYYTSDQ